LPSSAFFRFAPKPEVNLSIDRIVGVGERGWRKGWTRRLCGLEVGNEPGLLGRKVGCDFVRL